MSQRNGARIVLKDDFPASLATFGGVVSRRDGEGNLVATAALVDGGSCELIARHTSRLGADAGGDLLPSMLEALAGLPHAPDVVFISGHGTADQEHAGLAVRFGLASDLPCIGVADDMPEGLQVLNSLHDMRGAFTPLRKAQFQVGWMLRSRIGSEPLVVSPAHRVAMASSPELVMRCIRGHRLPEPLRLAAETP